MNAPEKRLPMSPLLAVGLVLAAKLGLVALFVSLITLRAGRGGNVERAAESLTSDPFTLAAVQAVVFGGTLLLGLVLTARDVPVRRALRLTRPRLGQVVAAAVAGLALAVALSELDNLLREIRPMTEAELAGRARLLGETAVAHRAGLVLAIVIVAPITEEALFRGLVQGGLERTRGPWLALALTSALFGLSHVDLGLGMDWPTLVVTAAAALYLGAVALVARTITPCVVAHASHNAVALVHPDELRIEGLNVLGEGVYHLPPVVVAASAAALVLALSYLRSPPRVAA